MKKTVAVLLLSLLAAAAFARDPAQVRAFRKANACPATTKTDGACPGWVVNHIVPLCFGGKDEPANMEWEQKAPSYKRDAFERALCKTVKPAAAASAASS